MGKKSNKKKSQSSKKKQSNEEISPLPVTILSGFLGSGKTTLLKNLLTSTEHQLKIAVIVNDMAELNIDAAAIKKQSVVQTKPEVVAMENGCICCNLRGDLIREIQRLYDSHEFDHVLVESTGIAEPQQVAESFWADPATAQIANHPAQRLWRVARLDTCVTVLDAHEFPRHLKSLQRFQDVFRDGLDSSAATTAASGDGNGVVDAAKQNDQEGRKSIAELVVEQVEFANVILLNKIDLVSESEQDATLKLVRTLNPKAKVIPTKFANVKHTAILNTGMFDMKEAEESPGWLVSLKQPADTLKSEAEEYGVSSMVYRARKPFHPGRLFDTLNPSLYFAEHWNRRELPVDNDDDDQREAQRTKAMEDTFGCQILRSKGYCWIAGRDGLTGDWAHSGRLIGIQPSTPWYTELPEEEWGVATENDDNNNGAEALQAIKDKFQGEHGDRRQEIVLIGTDLKKDVITAALDACLLTNKEMASYSYHDNGKYYDRLPPWIMDYDTPGTVTLVLRHGQIHRFQVSMGLQLSLTNLALNVVVPSSDEEEDDDEEDIAVSVKVWLDVLDGKRSALLATLRSTSNGDHRSINVNLPGETTKDDDENDDTLVTLRVEVPLSGRKRRTSDTGTTMDAAAAVRKRLLERIEVHVVGSVLPLPEMMMGDEDDDEQEGNGSNHDCDDPLGRCPRQ